MVLGTLYYHWNTRFFLYLNTKQYFCLLVKICCLYSPKFIHKNVHTVTQNYSSYKSAIDVYIVVANINVTVHIKPANINVTVHINKH